MTKNQPRMSNAVLQNVRLLFRNFSGAEKQYNPKGRRNFNIVLPPEVAIEMATDGWNVRELRAREEDEVPDSVIEVAVNFEGRPPRVVMVTSRGKTPLDEDTIDLLDWADITTADVILRPYQWEVNGKSGVKAYLQSLFVTIREDELELKYADVPEAGPTPVNEDEEEPPWTD